MTMKKQLTIWLGLICWSLVVVFLGGFEGICGAEEKYEPTWRSLKRHNTPQWLSDAKFGIYTQYAWDGQAKRLPSRPWEPARL